MDLNFRKRKRNPIETANFLSLATLWYTLPTFIRGYSKDFEMCDLYEPLKEHKSNLLGDQMHAEWKNELELAVKNDRKPSIKRVLVRMFGRRYLFYGFLEGICELVFKLIQPLALGELIAYYVPGQTDITKRDAYLYGALIIGCAFTNVLLETKASVGLADVGMRIKIACSSLIYRKALRLHKYELLKTPLSQIINLLSNDMSRFESFAILGNYLWIGPLQIIVVTYIMYQKIGNAATIGVSVILMFIPLQLYLGKKSAVLRLKTALKTDERIRLMSEIISGIQIIKMYAWENYYVQLVGLTRRHEMRPIQQTSYILSILSSLTMFMTHIPLYVTIIIMVSCNQPIDATKVYVLMALYNVLKQSIATYFAYGLSKIAETNISLSRINNFMLLREGSSEEDVTSVSLDHAVNTILEINNGFAKLFEKDQNDVLFDVNMSVKKGSLVGVIGVVGSGKSTLFNIILKEIPLISGSLYINGTISYSSQEPWIFPGTVRQNILCGLPLNVSRYKKVVRACSLESDFSLWSHADKTAIGERGITLSGGQRARINLARAVYRDADVYLLDDPLSAVDGQVGKYIFKKCICGLLKEKTVLLITHQMQHLEKMDNIILMEKGSVKIQGSLRDLQQSGLDFAQLLKKEPSEVIQGKDMLSEKLDSVSIYNDSSFESLDEYHEHVSKGSVSRSVYKAYFIAGTRWFVIHLILILFILAQLSTNAEDFFLMSWVNKEERNVDRNQQNNSSSVLFSDSLVNIATSNSIIIYTVLIFLTLILTMIKMFVFFSACTKSSVALHDSMLKNVSYATMEFFNNNNPGKILNRFSKDIGNVDELLPSCLIDSLQLGLILLGTIIAISIANQWLLLPTLIFCIIFYVIRKVYLATSQNVKRLEAITCSPVFSIITSTVRGLSTVRALGLETILQNNFQEYLDMHGSAFFLYLIIARALTCFLDILCATYTAIITLTFLLFNNDTFGGNVGLAITQALGLSGFLQWGIKQSTRLETVMTSVERVLEYTCLDREDKYKDVKPPKLWPTSGKIQFTNVSLRYSSKGPPVLKRLNFSIEPLEKIGIVGRTGAGKSSLIAALFRLSESSGTITIDGVSIGEIGLRNLRNKISIIPQEPVLFSGTLRRNLDLFDEYDDEVLWKVLEEVEMQDFVKNTHLGLQHSILEEGCNFSVGQRQLICLARAILRKNKILVLDEATANVDPQTDELIQRTIRSKFLDCTVLTIAHRLGTIIDSDRVMVLDAGCIVEFDHPYVLLQDFKGSFYKMVQQTSQGLKKRIFEVSSQNYQKKYLVPDLIKF